MTVEGLREFIVLQVGPNYGTSFEFDILLRPMKVFCLFHKVIIKLLKHQLSGFRVSVEYTVVLQLLRFALRLFLIYF